MQNLCDDDGDGNRKDPPPVPDSANNQHLNANTRGGGNLSTSNKGCQQELLSSFQ